MTAGTPLRWLAWPGAALPALTLFGFPVDAPAAAGDARALLGPLHRGACHRVWPSLIYVPVILPLLADLRPWRAIKLRRGAENGETPCPLRLP